MKEIERLTAENAALRERLSQFVQTGLSINQSLEFDSVLQSVLDSARMLTDARFAVITLQDGEGALQEYLQSGMSVEEVEGYWNQPDAIKLLDILSRSEGPIRINDVSAHLLSLGVTDLAPPFVEYPALCVLGVPVQHMGQRMGCIFAVAKQSADSFTADDEETLEMFASQAALVIANARTYRAERSARTDLETLVNTSPIGVVLFDARTGKMVSTNREARRMVHGLWSSGQTQEQFIKSITFVRADGREFALAELSLPDLFGVGETVRVEEIIIKTPDGRSVTMLVNATPIRSDDGAVVSFVVTLQDMSPMENLERLRAEFLGIVSHELRAPLTAVKGSATTLIQAINDLEPAEMLQFFKIIDEQTDRMRDLIGELLQVAQIEAGTLSVRPEPLEPADLIDEAKKRFLSGGASNNVLIDLNELLPRVMADRRRIVQVLSNLLSNAEKFSPESSPIRISATRKEQYVEISVIDRGMGFSPDAIPNLYGKFARHAAREDGQQVEDSGLGLSISKGIVESHGGRISASSQGPGTGSTFSFTLLAFQGDTTTGPGSTAISTSDDDQDNRMRDLPRILVVDDDPLVLRQVRNVLINGGYAPVVTGDPEEVMSLITEHEPSLVVLDLLLPGTDGIELMGRISAKFDMPVIFLSAYHQDEVVARAFELGAVDYIVKPFSESEMVARIGAALRKRAAWRLLEPPDPYVRNGLSINFTEHEVTVLGTRVDLTPTEYKLLFEMATNAGSVLTHDDLLRRIWDTKRERSRGLLRTVVKRLRQKLGDDVSQPQHIFTAPGMGYRMVRADDNRESDVDGDGNLNGIDD